MYACNGILFNHESPLRGETFVTRKITRAPGAHRARACRTACTSATSTRCATGATPRTTCEMQWLMLQQDAARGLRHRHRRAVQRARVRRARRRASSASSMRWRGRRRRRDRRRRSQRHGEPAGDRARSIRATSARPRSRRCSATRPRRSEKLGWTPTITFAGAGARDGAAPTCRPRERDALRQAARLRVLRLRTSSAMDVATDAKIFVAGHRGMVGSAHRARAAGARATTTC